MPKRQASVYCGAGEESACNVHPPSPHPNIKIHGASGVWQAAHIKPTTRRRMRGEEEEDGGLNVVGERRLGGGAVRGWRMMLKVAWCGMVEKVSSHNATSVVIHHNYHRGSLTAIEIMGSNGRSAWHVEGSGQGQVSYCY